MANPDPIPLIDFLTEFAAELAADPVEPIRAACDVGLGIWTRPEAPCQLSDSMIRRPATHMHEIRLLDVSAMGDTERAAAAHWLYVARWTAAGGSMSTHYIPAMDMQRVLTLAAFDALIEVSLSHTAEPTVGTLPGFSARHLVEQLHSSGLADVTSTADSLTMRLYGVTASAHGGTALALLRNWQRAARDSMATQAVRG